MGYFTDFFMTKEEEKIHWIRIPLGGEQEIYKEYDTKEEQQNALKSFKVKIKHKVIDEIDEGHLTNFGEIQDIYYGSD